jgi:hypothetical protein
MQYATLISLVASSKPMTSARTLFQERQRGFAGLGSTSLINSTIVVW